MSGVTIYVLAVLGALTPSLSLPHGPLTLVGFSCHSILIEFSGMPVHRNLIVPTLPPPSILHLCRVSGGMITPHRVSRL
jgi:hypothetical protein